jgi:hypothetical protein
MLLRYLTLHHYLLPVGLFFIFAPCAGQVDVSVRMATDSLYRHISRETNTGFSCSIIYTRGSDMVFSGQGRNATELEKLDQFIRQVLSHPTLFISRIRLTGYSSVEGSYARNEYLAQERIEQFYTYLCGRYPELRHYPHDQAWVAEDWNGLSRLIKESPLRERKEVLEIIRKVPAYDTREVLLERLNGGYAWLFMEREIFPRLRRVELCIELASSTVETRKPATASLQPAVPIVSPQPEASLQSEVSPQPSPTNGRRESKERELGDTSADSLNRVTSFPLSFDSRRPLVGEGRGKAVAGLWTSTHFSLKTNLLLLAGVQSDFKYTAPVVNLALEYYISDHWSLEAGMTYSRWYYNSHREFQGTSGYRLEPRYRFRFLNDRLKVYLGLYGKAGDYNSQTINKKVNYEPFANGNSDAGVPGAAPETLNYTDMYWDTGLSGGFTVKLAGSFGLEAGVRGGYVHTYPNKYVHTNDHNWFDGRWKYSGVRITDLNVSLIYRFK